jgi:hypothetical protein
LDIGEALAREFFDEVAVGHSLGSDFFAAHESVPDAVDGSSTGT